jgi:imidazolonepropionase-like amidohydrolase
MHSLRENLLAAAFVLGCCTAPIASAQGEPSSAVLFENVRIFNGTSGQLSTPANVLVVGNVIKTISAAPIADPAVMTVQRIRGDGRTLMPGLIDNHWHTMLARPSAAQAINGDLGYTTLLAGFEAQATLMRGFTTVRDLGGPSFSLKRAIDEGLVVGPRIYPSGAMITITGGHGDFRNPSELPRVIGGPLSRMEVIGGSMVADSPDEVRVRAREQLLLGASQIKLTAGGGVASPHSPLDVSTFTEEELRAAVQAVAGTERTVALAKKYKLKMAFGTDLLFSPAGAARQGAELVKMRKWYTAPELLVMATGTNAELLKLSGPRDPYPGKLGVVEEGAFADLLLVAGDPIANINLIADSERNFVLIMKDGKIYKNSLSNAGSARTR